MLLTATQKVKIRNKNMTNKLKSQPGYCLYCNKPLKRTHQIYCSNKCQQLFRRTKIFQKIEEDGYFPFNEKTNETDIATVRKYLIEKFGHKCSICGLSEWMGKPIPLVADHIDGDTSNHKIENFRMVCENCNALLPTYKSKNRKSKRHWRKKYY